MDNLYEHGTRSHTDINLICHTLKAAYIDFTIKYLFNVSNTRRASFYQSHLETDVADV